MHERLSGQPAHRLNLAGDQLQDFGEQRQWNRHLGKLKGDVPTVPDHLGADLDQLLP